MYRSKNQVVHQTLRPALPKDRLCAIREPYAFSDQRSQPPQPGAPRGWRIPSGVAHEEIVFPLSRDVA